MRRNGAEFLGSLNNDLSINPTTGKVYLRDVELGNAKMMASWDTGYSVTSVDSAYVASHKDAFIATGKKIHSKDVSGAIVDLRLYKAKSITIAGQRFDNEYVMAEDFSRIRENAGDEDIGMVLGYNLITKLNWRIDLKNKRWSAERH